MRGGLHFSFTQTKRAPAKGQGGRSVVVVGFYLTANAQPQDGLSPSLP